MIELRNIKKAYQNKSVLNDINLTIEDGNVHVLFGKNGCGKTTLVKIIADLIDYDSGSVIIDQIHIDGSKYAYRKNMGYAFEDPMLINEFTIKSFLNFSLTLQKMQRKDYENRINDLCHLFDLSKNERLKSLSKGQKMKVAISASLLHQPSHLIWDEPLSGVDLISIKKILQILNKMKQNGCCIFLTTHRYEVILEIADHVSILDNGLIKKTLSRDEFSSYAANRKDDFEEKLFDELTFEGTKKIPKWIYER